MTVTATILYKRQYAGDDGPGEGLRRVARQVHRDAERGAAAGRGLDGDRRVHPGDAWPAGLQLHHDRRPPGRRARQQPWPTQRQPEVRAAGRPSRCRASNADVKVASHRWPTGATCSTSARRCCSRARRSARCTSASTRRRCPRSPISCWCMLAILTLVTIAAVGGGTYLLARGLAGPMRVLRNSLDELANGRYDYRIADKRKDELGELYAEFDRTAAALEARHDPPQPAIAPPMAPPDGAGDVAGRRLRAEAGLAHARGRARGCDRRGDRPGGLRGGAAASAAGAGAARRRASGPGARARRQLRRRRRRRRARRSARWRSATSATAAGAGGSPSSTTSTRSGRVRWSSIPLQGDQSVGRATPTATRRCRSSAITASAPRASQLDVTPAAFEAQMDYLARNGYHVIPLSRARRVPRARRAAAGASRW